MNCAEHWQTEWKQCLRTQVVMQSVAQEYNPSRATAKAESSHFDSDGMGSIATIQVVARGTRNQIQLNKLFSIFGPKGRICFLESRKYEVENIG